MFTCGIKMHLRQLASQDTSPFTPIQGGRGCKEFTWGITTTESYMKMCLPVITLSGTHQGALAFTLQNANINIE